MENQQCLQTNQFEIFIVEWKLKRDKCHDYFKNIEIKKWKIFFKILGYIKCYLFIYLFINELIKYNTAPYIQHLDI